MLRLEDAVKFLESEKVIVPDLPDDELTWLQERCVRSIEHHWKLLLNSSGVQASLRRLNPFLCSAALTRCLEQSNEETIVYDAMDNEGLPTSIIVEGLGIAALNGIYLRFPRFHRTNPRYYKNGVWDGQDRKFVIHMADMGPTAKNIWIFCFQDKSQKEEDCDFFFAHPSSNPRLASFPRMNGWLGDTTNAPYETAPSLTYKFDD